MPKVVLEPAWDNDLPDLPRRRHGIDYAARGLAEHRTAERQTGAKSVWIPTNPGAVISQSLIGQAQLSRLDRPGPAIWRFGPPNRLATAPLVLAEGDPAQPGRPVAQRKRQSEVKASPRVRLLAQALAALGHRGRMGELFADGPPVAREEGWILGASHAELLQAAVGDDAGRPQTLRRRRF